MNYRASVLVFSVVVFLSACQKEKGVLEERSVSIASVDHPIERARKIRKQLLEGASFREMAEKYSADPGSAQYGGELGRVHFGQFVPEFEKAIRSLKSEEVSEPVRTDFGYHIIELVAKDETSFTSRHILIRP